MRRRRIRALPACAVLGILIPLFAAFADSAFADGSSSPWPNVDPPAGVYSDNIVLTFGAPEGTKFRFVGVGPSGRINSSIPSGPSATADAANVSGELLDLPRRLYLSAASGEERSYRIELVRAPGGASAGAAVAGTTLTYTIDRRPPKAPDVDLVPGTYAGPQKVSFSKIPDAEVRFLLAGQGTEATASATVPEGTPWDGTPLTLSAPESGEATTTVYAYSIDAAGNTSSVRSWTYHLIGISRDTGEFRIASPVSGTYANAQLLYVTAGPFDDIRYTTDGTDPRTHGFPYRSAVLIPGTGAITIRVSAGNTASEGDAASFVEKQVTIRQTGAAPPPGITVPPQGEHLDAVRILPPSADASAATADSVESTPSRAGAGAPQFDVSFGTSPRETDRVPFTAATTGTPIPGTLSLFVVTLYPARPAAAGTATPFRYTYVLDGRRPAAPAIAVDKTDAGGGIPRVAISGEPGASIRYTTDGTEPDQSSELYSSTFRPSVAQDARNGSVAVRAAAYFANGARSTTAFMEVPFDTTKPASPRVEVSSKDDALGIIVSASAAEGTSLRYEIAYGGGIPETPTSDSPAFGLSTSAGGSSSVTREMAISVPFGLREVFSLAVAAVSAGGVVSDPVMVGSLTIDREPPPAPHIIATSRPLSAGGTTLNVALDGTGALSYRITRDGSPLPGDSGDPHAYRSPIELPSPAGVVSRYEVTAWAADPAGNLSAPAMSTLTADNVVPTISGFLGLPDTRVASQPPATGPGPIAGATEGGGADFTAYREATIVLERLDPSERFSATGAPEATPLGAAGSAVAVQAVGATSAAAAQAPTQLSAATLSAGPSVAPGAAPGAATATPAGAGGAVASSLPESARSAGVRVVYAVVPRGVRVHYTLTRDGTIPPDPQSTDPLLSQPVSIATPEGADVLYRLKLGVEESTGGVDDVKAFAFRVDRKPPEAPMVGGVTAGTAYAGPVALSVEGGDRTDRLYLAVRPVGARPVAAPRGTVATPGTSEAPAPLGSQRPENEVSATVRTADDRGATSYPGGDLPAGSSLVSDVNRYFASVTVAPPEGTRAAYTAQAAAVDEAGNITTAGPPIEFEIDRTPQPAPRLFYALAATPGSIREIPDGGEVTVGGPVLLYANPSDAGASSNQNDSSAPRAGSTTYISLGTHGSPATIPTTSSRKLGAEGMRIAPSPGTLMDVVDVRTVSVNSVGKRSNIAEALIRIDSRTPSAPAPTSGPGYLSWPTVPGVTIWYRVRGAADSRYRPYAAPVIAATGSSGQLGMGAATITVNGSEPETVEYYGETKAGIRGPAAEIAFPAAPSMSQPPAPVITGAATGGIYNHAVTLTNATPTGQGQVRYLVSIDGSISGNVGPFSPVLPDTLTLDAPEGATEHFSIHAQTYTEDGAQSSRVLTMSFTVDHTPPGTPVLTGAENGQFYRDTRTVGLTVPGSPDALIYFKLAEGSGFGSPIPAELPSGRGAPSAGASAPAAATGPATVGTARGGAADSNGAGTLPGGAAAPAGGSAAVLAAGSSSRASYAASGAGPAAAAPEDSKLPGYSQYTGPIPLAAHAGSLADYTITAYAIDSAGNRSNGEVTYHVSIDREVIYLRPPTGTEDETAGDGSRDNPYVSVRRAIDGAERAGRGTIFVASGTYELEEPLEITRDVRIVGGFDSKNWTTDGKSPGETILRVADDYEPAQGAPVRINSGAATFSRLLITSEEAPVATLLDVRGGSAAIVASTIRVGAGSTAINEQSGDLLISSSQVERSTSADSAAAPAGATAASRGAPVGRTAVLVSKSSTGVMTVDSSQFRPGVATRTVGILIENGSATFTNSEIFAGSGKLSAVAVEIAGPYTSSGHVPRIVFSSSSVHAQSPADTAVAISSSNADLMLDRTAVTVSARNAGVGILIRDGTLTMTRSSVDALKSNDYLWPISLRSSRARITASILRGGSTGDSLLILAQSTSLELVQNSLAVGDGSLTNTGIRAEGNSPLAVVNNVLLGTRDGRGTALLLANWDGILQLKTNALGSWLRIIGQEATSAADAYHPLGYRPQAVTNVDQLNSLIVNNSSISGNIAASFGDLRAVPGIGGGPAGAAARPATAAENPTASGNGAESASNVASAAAAASITGPGAGSIAGSAAEPGAEPDFHLRAGAPEVGSGSDVTSYGIVTDYEGNPVPAPPPPGPPTAGNVKGRDQLKQPAPRFDIGAMIFRGD